MDIVTGEDGLVGTVVQFALHAVNDPNKVNGRNMTCVVVTKVKGKGYLEAPKYRLACTAGTFHRLYHRNYLEVVKNATPELTGLLEALARWMYLPLIKEREDNGQHLLSQNMTRKQKAMDE